jgi:pimeloyl-ACP methyl ester carboxylesterase
MATFVMIHGSGDVGWYWHLVADDLRARRHDVLAPDLPCDDDSAGLAEYTDVIVDAVGAPRDLVVVAQSAGAYVAPLVCAHRPVELLVLVAGLVPSPGEAARDWWANTGYEPVRGDWSGDEAAIFYHDVPPDLAAEAMRRSRAQSDTPGNEPWPLESWPDVPTRFLLCRDDRLLPPDFLRRVVRERLGIEPDEIDAGHCVALSRPAELAQYLYETQNALARSDRFVR